MGATYSQALLAEAYGKVGRVEEGLAVLAKALAVVDKTGERFYEAELYRIKGELTLQSSVQRLGSRVKTGPQSRVHSPKSSKATSQILNPQSHAEVEAEECFRKAIEIAQKQQAKSWELRTATSLARLWQVQGKRKEALDLLKPVYEWFTEGFDTKDLKEAKALLEELAAGA